MNKLYIIDGHALVFKMFYAFAGRPMVNSKGQDTSILFGFTKYILELIDRERPTHFAVSFDPPGGTFRHQIYPDYKANRLETPQLVIGALEPLCHIVRSMHIPVLMERGYEADDVIGTVAKRFASETCDVYMVTPDKDYGQLVAAHIFQYKPSKQGSENEILSVEEVCAKWNISSAEQVIDMLAICGDASDNVPGVKGVGPVGAAKLISRYKSVEGIYEHISELTPKQQEQFRAAEAHIGLSKRLVTIATDVPMELTEQSLRFNMLYTSELDSILQQYEFPSLRRLVAKITGSIRPVPTPPASQNAQATGNRFNGNSAQDNTSVMSATDGQCAPDRQYKPDGQYTPNGQYAPNDRLTDDFLRLPEVSATEFLGKPRSRVALREAERGVYLCDYDCYAHDSAEVFRSLLEDAKITKVGYGFKELLLSLSRQSIELKGPLEDIEIMHYLLNPERSHKLEMLVRGYLSIELSIDEGMQTGSLFDDVESKEITADKTKEALVLLPLADRFKAEMSAAEGMTRLYSQIEEPLVPVLARMEKVGVKIDLSSLAEYASALRKSMLEQESKVRAIAEDPKLNVSSPKQIGVLIFEKLKLDPKARKPRSGNWPTDETTLQELSEASPVVDAILEYRGLRKLLSTYIDPFPSYISPIDGRVHTTFNQTLTSTGRLSSSNPNLQNIPIRTDQGRVLRRAFVPGDPDCVMMSADYSQIELRIMAHLCGDEHLTQAFREGLDVHSATAAKIFAVDIDAVQPDQRRIAKTANFGIMYGISAFGLSQRLHCSRTEARQIIDDYFASFPSIRSFIDETLSAARANGYVETLYGRRRYLPDISSANSKLRALAERNAVNAPIQGTAADIIKLAMCAVDKRLQALRSRMVLQIHDELLLEVPREEIEIVRPLLVDAMENVISLSVPLTVECNYGENWLDAH